MWIGLIALLPELFTPLQKVGVTSRAYTEKRWSYNHYQPRDFSPHPHKKVDDHPYGGGAGMILSAPAMCAAIAQARSDAPADTPVIALSARGIPFNQALAQQLSGAKGIILVAGRYQGIDERVLNTCDYELSVGNYVLSGGELAAAIVSDAILRLLPDVIGNRESLENESFNKPLVEYPQYTRPATHSSGQVPVELLSGNHQAIARWRMQQALGQTWLHRPELFAKLSLTEEQQALWCDFVANHAISGEET